MSPNHTSCPFLYMSDHFSIMEDSDWATYLICHVNLQLNSAPDKAVVKYMIGKETNSPNVLLTRFALPFFTIYGKTIVTAKAGRKCSDSEFVPRFSVITKFQVVS